MAGQRPKAGDGFSGDRRQGPGGLGKAAPALEAEIKAVLGRPRLPMSTGRIASAGTSKRPITVALAECVSTSLSTTPGRSTASSSPRYSMKASPSHRRQRAMRISAPNPAGAADSVCFHSKLEHICRRPSCGEREP